MISHKNVGKNESFLQDPISIKKESTLSLEEPIFSLQEHASMDEDPTTPTFYNSNFPAANPDGEPSLELSAMQQGLTSLLFLICIGSLIAGFIFQRTLRHDRFKSVRTAFNRLLFVRTTTMQVNLLVEMALLASILQSWWSPQPDVCLTLSLLSALLAFTITYMTMWLSLVRLLLLAAARWALGMAGGSPTSASTSSCCCRTPRLPLSSC